MMNVKRRIRRAVATLVVASFVLVGVTSPAAAATPAEIEEAIEQGLEWLAGQQVLPAGYFEDPAHSGFYPVALTAYALVKFEDHAARLRKDPFDPSYEYHTAVEKGWDYLSTKMATQTLSLQSGNDPEQYTDGDNTGIYFPSARSTYETGIVMMALGASGLPTRPFPGSTLTFNQVLEDCVDWSAWAQTDTGWGRGGWDYAAHDNSGSGGDNSISQWPVLGLMAAEQWGIIAPDFVKNELVTYWLNYSQGGDGCFGYRGPPPSYTGGGPFAVTASGMIQLTYCGVPTSDSRWTDASQCICNNWAGGNNIGNLYAMYGLMKAAVIAEPNVVEFCGHDWQEEYDEWIVENQVIPGGYWPAQYALPWHGSSHDKVLATEYALLILQKVVPTEEQVIPTVSEWGLMVMTLLGLTGGTIVFARRRAKAAS